ncbi:hypothetical protein GA0070606_5956 [Micromonospora citrea]|uniref:Uncharacterized protein n=1 Tax=Micromonospora citrea TaxID=47855 RepID=A0A1C6W0L3_9ACTN|nr:DUF6528 family protein [Micromonospora citrea]SCL72103.1 hypothetical protein GA0070606_5956 [Micromonospora citrea]
MQRRTILRGLAAGAVAAPTAALLGPAPAQAATSYYVATTEQVKNKILVFHKNKSWTDANVHWSFSPGGGAWANLSDVKIRSTQKQGWIALMVSSGGRAGIVDIDSEKHTELNDLAWSATPGGNPHAIERIPEKGAVVVASSHGYLTLYAPKSVGDLGSLAKVQTVSLPGAHGVLWDPTYKILWAIGKGKLVHYAVEGSRRNTRLKYYGGSVSLGSNNLGHDLQPDYGNKYKLLCTATDGVYEINTSGGSFTKRKISSETRVKSYVRHSSGEVVSVRADNTGSRTWGSPTVRFSQSPDRKRSGAEFYKARIWTPGFE